MFSTMKIFLTVVLFSTVLASAYHSSAKLRRDGVLNLYPFPRVGRASRNTWQLPLNDFYLEYAPTEKRQLYAFPRVGRSDSSLKHEESSQDMSHMSDNPGMWFGPRLGRSYKNDENDVTIQSGANDHSEPEQTESFHEERKKREVA